jgi:hypothetical protein
MDIGSGRPSHILPDCFLGRIEKLMREHSAQELFKSRHINVAG